MGLAWNYGNLVLDLSNKAGVTFALRRHHSQLIAQCFHRQQLSCTKASEESMTEVNELDRSRHPEGEVRSGTVAVHCCYKDASP